MTLRLAIFDVDGTLVDSQADIIGSMEAAFNAEGSQVPSRKDILGIVGLSLPQAMAVLAPDQPAHIQARMVEAYKDSYATLRRQNGAQSSPLYPGIAQMLQRLGQQDDLLMAVATGKSRRGLDALMETHGLRHHFVSLQCADDHPSKPHPSMLHQAMWDAGVEAAQSVMIGDTSFDLEMAKAAGMAGIGVTWGYHPKTRLAALASGTVDTVAELEDFIPQMLGGSR